MHINVLKEHAVFRAPAFLVPIYQTMQLLIPEGSNLCAHRHQSLNPDTANSDRQYIDTYLNPCIQQQ